MSHPFQSRLKQWPHSRVEQHFIKMCGILPYGRTLRDFGIGMRIRMELDIIRMSIMDSVNPPEEFEE